ncbi:Ribosomal RNA small subunit methyltransferase nep-1 [Euphorbia peplus]|nr:Ribosomal RNA small subunit methyltransferase nep-1 [Euphorbia peplus]
MDDDNKTQVKTSRAIIVLENASLEKGFVRKKPKILSSVEDAHFLNRLAKKKPTDYRPELVHFALLEILDSAANEYGMLYAIYIRTYSDLLFEIKPHARIPRDCIRFCGVIWEVLMCILKEHLSSHLPKHAHVIGFSHKSPKVVGFEKYVVDIVDDVTPVFVVSTTVHGEVRKDNCDEYFSASNYPIGSKCCACVVCEALEQ